MAHADVAIKSTCHYGGMTGKLISVQDFPGQPNTLYFLVIIPEINQDTGFWYRAECLDVVHGNLPAYDKKNSYLHKVEKNGKIAYFRIDKSSKDVLIAEGYKVTYPAY